MKKQSRRDFLAGASALAVSGIATGVQAAMGPGDKFDLVIKGGEVLDPSQKLRAKRDIGIRFGIVEAVEADIPAARANRVMNAAGRLVVPGLIDLHSHVYTTGIGIPPDELEPIFEEFYQTEDGRRARRGGTGLGLSLTRNFVELHHGRIEVQSKPGQGSTFSLYLPIDFTVAVAAASGNAVVRASMQ